MDKFGKICQHHWKERYKISKIAKFENEISQMFVWCGGTNLPPNIQMTENICNFAGLYLGSLKMYHFQIWQLC